MRAVVLLLVLLVGSTMVASDYAWRAVTVGPNAAQVSKVEWNIPTITNTDNSTQLAAAVSSTYTRRLADFRAISPQGYAAAVDETTNTTFTVSSTESGWRVCAWRDGNAPPTCSNQIAALADGVPTCMVYLGSRDDLLLVVFPNSGKIIRITGRGLVAGSQPWATPSGTPVYITVDEAKSIVYLALLNSNRIVRYDFSGVQLDADDSPWLLVPRPRFVLLNKIGTDNTFYVMSLDVDEPELHLFDAQGNSLGSISDTVGQWVCDEPGGSAPEPGEEYIPRVISIGVNSTSGVLYTLKNNHHTTVDEYSIYTGLPVTQTSIFIKDAVAFVPDAVGGASTPEAIIDSYSVNGDGRKFVFIGCNGGGNTLDNIRGAWPCAEPSTSTVVYDAQNVYLLDGNGCFVSYLFYCADNCIHDTFLDGDTLYVLRKDGVTLRLSAVCAVTGNPGQPRELANATLNPATLTVLGTDYFVFDGTPCLSTSTELLCAGSERIEIQTGDMSIVYITRLQSVLVIQTLIGADVASFHVQTLNLKTGKQSGAWLEPPAHSQFVLMADRDSGVWGLLDSVSGILYEYNDQLEQLEAVARNVTLPGSYGQLTGWTLRDSMGPAIRYPALPTTEPPSTTKPPPPPTKTVSFAVIVSIIASVLMTLCICGCIIVLCVNFKRRNDKQRESGNNAQGIAPAVTYGDDDASFGYTLGPRLRYAIRELFCACSCCWNPITQRLRCCASVLGGRKGPERSCCGRSRREKYAEMDDTMFTGEGESSTPSFGEHRNAPEETEPVNPPPMTDRTMGDSGVLQTVQL